VQAAAAALPEPLQAQTIQFGYLRNKLLSAVKTGSLAADAMVHSAAIQQSQGTTHAANAVASAAMTAANEAASQDAQLRAEIQIAVQRANASVMEMAHMIAGRVGALDRHTAFLLSPTAEPLALVLCHLVRTALVASLPATVIQPVLAQLYPGMAAIVQEVLAIDHAVDQLRQVKRALLRRTLYGVLRALTLENLCFVLARSRWF
jgi:hypothetical protein